MLRLSNIRIGTKLMAMSGLGILLVAAMLFILVNGNANVKAEMQASADQGNIAEASANAKASIRGLQIGVRDLRLADSVEDLEKAKKYLADREASAVKFLDSAVGLATTPENIERLKKAKQLVQTYVELSKGFEPIQLRLISLRKQRADGGNVDDLTKQVVEATAQMKAYARDRTLPVATAVEEVISKAVSVASKLSDDADASARSAMATAERIGLAVGGSVILLLIGSAVFGAISIARPIGKMSTVLGELTKDNIVDVPYTSRGDEIGQIAKATEMFRESIAEKVTNLRVRRALDVVSSNVMVADDNYNIMYANNTLQEMLQNVEAEVRKILPQFDAAKIVGANMDIFHREPSHQRAMMDKLTGSHETHIAIGSKKFHLFATAIIDKSGKRAGTVVEWRDETAELAIQAEVGSLVTNAVAGEFEGRIPLDGKKGFMLTLTESMNSLCENIATVMNDMVGMFGGLADGDFTRRITAEYQGSFGKLKSDANMMADRISATVSEIKASTREVTNASAEIATSSTDLSQRTEEQAASLEQTSAAMEQLAATVAKNAENAKQASASATGTRDVADRGGQVVGKAVEAMAKIEDSSRKISDIIGVIDEIARQTNLLALNAAVEAARAGDAGRGFAVVASEVRSLAQRSSQAAKDIKDLITNSNNQVKEGVDLVNRAGSALTEIVGSIKSVADIVANIASASAEQATGLEEINKALSQMDEVTQQNSALVEENAATAKTLENQAKSMDEQVAYFRIENAGAAEVVVKQAVGQNRSFSAPASKPAARPAPAARPRPVAAAKADGGSAEPAKSGGTVGRMQNALATAIHDNAEWKEF